MVLFFSQTRSAAAMSLTNLRHSRENRSNEILALLVIFTLCCLHGGATQKRRACGPGKGEKNGKWCRVIRTTHIKAKIRHVGKTTVMKTRKKKVHRSYWQNLIATANSMSRFHLDNYGIMKAVILSGLWITEGTIEAQLADCVWPWTCDRNKKKIKNHCLINLR